MLSTLSQPKAKKTDASVKEIENNQIYTIIGGLLSSTMCHGVSVIVGMGARDLKLHDVPRCLRDRPTEWALKLHETVIVGLWALELLRAFPFLMSSMCTALAMNKVI